MTPATGPNPVEDTQLNPASNGQSNPATPSVDPDRLAELQRELAEAKRQLAESTARIERALHSGK